MSHSKELWIVADGCAVDEKDSSGAVCGHGGVCMASTSEWAERIATALNLYFGYLEQRETERRAKMLSAKEKVGKKARVYLIEEHRCSHSRVKPGDYHCTMCGKQLRKYRCKQCPGCAYRIYEEEWESILFIQPQRRGDLP